jgi:hypothetical protein
MRPSHYLPVFWQPKLLVTMIGCYCAILTKGYSSDLTAICGIVKTAQERHLTTILYGAHRMSFSIFGGTQRPSVVPNDHSE